MFRSVDNEHFVIRSEEGSDDDVKAVMCFYIFTKYYGLQLFTP